MEYVSVVVAPNQRYTMSINGENFVYTQGMTVQVLASEAVYLRRDGVII